MAGKSLEKKQIDNWRRELKQQGFQFQLRDHFTDGVVELYENVNSRVSWLKLYKF